MSAADSCPGPPSAVAEGTDRDGDPCCVVAVDVGNTAVKLTLRIATAMEHREIRIGTGGWELAAIGWVRDRLASHCAAGRPPQWRIAGVHRSATSRLQHAIDSSHPEAPIRLVNWLDVPLAMQVDFPDRVGIDRLLSAYAAWKRFSSPAVVIDAGSAITVDWLGPGGVLAGGAILPGLELQARSLVMGTDALPQIDPNREPPAVAPAKNTGEAIRAGIVLGTAAALGGLVDRYAGQDGLCDGSFQVVLTGGNAPTLSPYLRRPHRLIPNLVCEALLMLDRLGGSCAEIR